MNHPQSATPLSELEKELETKRRFIDVARKEKEILEAKVVRLEEALISEREESEALAHQFAALKEAIFKREEEAQLLRRELSSVKGELEEGRGKGRDSEELLSKQALELEKLEAALIKGQKEGNALRLHYQNALQEKSALLQKLAQMQQHGQSQKELWIKEIQELRKAEADFTRTKEENGRLLVALDDHGKKIKEQEEKISVVVEAKYQISQKLEGFEAKLREKEADVKEAEQHLAKKVREAQSVIEKYEEQKKLINSLTADLEKKSSKLAEVQGLLEAREQNERRLLEQIERLEDKYLKTHEKVQRMQARIDEYKALEEKHQQMRALLMNLGTVIEAETEAPPQVKKMAMKAPSKPNLMEMDLFASADVSTPKLQESFFD